jgi:hypothetical protein
MSIPPCSDAEEGVGYPCDECNRHFRSRTCFAKHKINKMHGSKKKKKTVCEETRRCGTCSSLITRKNHECFKPFCVNCSQNREIGHLCYMQPLKNVLPRSDDVLFVFYHFETTQEARYTDMATQHVPNVVCAQQLFSLRDAAVTCTCTARGAESEHTRSTTTLSVTFSPTYVNLARGQRVWYQSHTMPAGSTCSLYLTEPYC